MQLFKKVLIKQVITKKSKQVLQQKFKAKIVRLERECQQLLFEQRKLKNRVSNKEAMLERFQQEINQRKDKIKLTEFKLEQLELVEIGSEMVEREMDGIINVEVGMNWKEIDKQTSIIIKDDVVIRMDTE